MGGKYTCCNGYGNDTFSNERLDRVVENPAWAEKFEGRGVNSKKLESQTTPTETFG